MSLAWPSRSKDGVVRSFRAVNGAVYANANVVLYLVTATLGGIIYPVYRVGVRGITTANYFAPGHQVRIEIAGSSFPPSTQA